MVQRNAAVRDLAVVAQNQLDVFELAAQASVDGV
jgi:hypothetical protein